jgi:hypothetical protein
MKKEYTVVFTEGETGENPRVLWNLAVLVDGLLQQGWMCQGGVSLNIGPSGNLLSSAQAMTRGV